MHDLSAYGRWQLVIINSAIFLFFAFSFYRPQSSRDWRTFGAFSAFVVALFTEMYGFPLTVYLISGWLGSRYPEIDWFSHNSGHLLQTIFGWQGNPHFAPFHWISDIFIWGGLILLGASWRVLFKAQCCNQLATTGPYARIRHPQYAAFILIMLGFLIQWPTLPTLIMFPILVFIYVRLALREERESQKAFGELYALYAEQTSRFIPRFFHLNVKPIGDGGP